MKTAIEWLESEILKLENKHKIPVEVYKLCEKAIAMEKQQIHAAWVDGFYTDWRSSKMPSDYYDEIFKQQDNDIRTEHD